MKKIILTILFVAAVAIAGYCDNPPPPFNPGDPSPIPVDGGISFLLASGAVYGIKKVRDLRKQKESGQEKAD
jgi:hypothetical protein